MTLNQLSLAMWERLGYQGIDASVLSRVINGERLFTIKQLEVFCQVLRIDERKKIMLKEILVLEKYKKLNLQPIGHDLFFFNHLTTQIIDKTLIID